MPKTRAVLLVFSVSNFLLTWLLLVFAERAKESLGESLPVVFYYGRTIAHIMMAVALVAIFALVFPWIVKSACLLSRRRRASNNGRPKIASTDGALLIISLASYLAVVVTICTVVMANSRCVVNGIIVNCGVPSVEEDGKQEGITSGLLRTSMSMGSELEQ